MNNKTKTRSLKVAIIAVALLLCLALAIGITGAFYQAKRQATGTLSMDQGIIIDYKGFGKTPDEGIWTRETTTTFLLFDETNAQPGQNIPVNAAGIRANEKSVNFYARVKLSYKFYNGETPVEFAESTKLIKTSSSFFGTNWVESGDGYFYYAAGSTLNKFEKGTQTFVDLFATDAKFIIEGAGFTGATSDGEGGGFVVGDTSINKIEVYLTLETLQGDADAAAEGWKITEVVKPIEVDVTTEEKPDINIDDIISDDKKDGEITIAGEPTAKKTILIGSRAFEGCTNLRLKLNNSSNITYIIASDAFSEGAKIWYGAAEATNLLINANTTGKTEGKDNAWRVAEPNLKVFLPTGVTQNSTNTSYGKYQYTDDQGTWYFDLIDSSGNTVTLSSTNNMSVSTLGASTYANTNTYTAKLRKFVPKTGVTTVVTPKFIGISQDSDKYAVTELYKTFQNCSGLTSITIPGGVKEIGSFAFESCSGLSSITIPDGVTSIGSWAFQGCYGLTSITISDSVTSIGENAFGNCRGLTSITIPEGVTSIEGGAFQSCSGLTSITIPEGVTSIGRSAFEECSGLTSITIPDSVTSIENSAFSGCSGLTLMRIGAGIQEVSWLLSNVSSMTITISENNPYLATDSKAIFAKSNGKLSVSKYISTETTYNIPSAVNGLSVTSIGNTAFQFDSGLTSIIIPDSVTSIENSAFSGCSGLTLMRIGAGIQEVSWLLSNVSSMTITISENNPYLATDSKAIFTKSNGKLSVSKYISAETTYDIPSAVNGLSVTSILSGAFILCSGLTSIIIPDSVTSIGDSVFYECSGLTSIIIPDSVTSIGGCAFYKCSGLSSVTIGSGVTTIGERAFQYCGDLTSIDIPNSVTSIGDGAFFDTNLTSITIPDSVTSIGESAFENCTSLTSVTIGNSVTSIGRYVFSECSGLTSITIPDSVTSIGVGAFASCSGLTSITIPGGVTYIDWEAFSGCSGLTSITIPDSVTSIANYAFQNCSGLTSVVIKGKITAIPSYCFSGCSSLESIVLPSSVTTIEEGAFSGCSKLTTVYVDSADATLLGFTKVDDTLYNENGIKDANGKYYKYTGKIA